MRVITCEYLEVEIAIIVFYCDTYWYCNEDDFVYYQEDSRGTLLNTGLCNERG